MSDSNRAAMCIYCGETVIYDAQEGEVSSMAEAHQRLVDHDQCCDHNPLVIQRKKLRDALHRAADDLAMIGRVENNYLAKSGAERCKAALNAKGGGSYEHMAGRTSPRNDAKPARSMERQQLSRHASIVL